MTAVLTDGDDLHGEELLLEDQAMEFPLGDWNAVVPAINHFNVTIVPFGKPELPVIESGIVLRQQQSNQQRI